MRPSQPAGGPAAVSRRAAIRKRISSGEIDVIALLNGRGDEDIEAEAMEMRVSTLISAVPGVGDATLERVLNGRVGPTTRLAAVTTRKRRALADSLKKELQP